VDRIDKVTKADIRRVADKVFVESNRTVAMIESKSAQSKPTAMNGSSQKPQTQEVH
jgi:predicted Zn-dependent peptidase